MKANSRAMILIRLFPVNELAIDFPSSRVDHGYLKVMMLAQAVVAEMPRKLFAVRDSLKIAVEVDPDPISKRDAIFHIKKEFRHCRYLKSISAIGDHARVTITGKGLLRLRALPRMTAIDRFNETAMLARGVPSSISAISRAVWAVVQFRLPNASWGLIRPAIIRSQMKWFRTCGH
jgi:hypothetical protein